MSIRMTIESETASVMVLSREAYDALKLSNTVSSYRTAQLAQQRDRLIERVKREQAEHKKAGYNDQYYSSTELLRILRDAFELPEPEPEPEPAAPAQKAGD